MAGNKPLGNMIIGVSMDGTQFAQTLDGIKKEIKQAQSAMKANLSVLSSAGDEYATLEAKVQGLNEVMSVNQRQIDALRKKYKDMVETYGENSKEARNYAIQINNAISKQGAWERQLQQTKSRLEELNNTNKSFTSHLSSIGSSLKESQSRANEWSGALAKAFTAPMVAISALGAKVSSEISNISANIQAMTGATAGEARKQGNIAGQVWAEGFGESTEQVGEAVVKIKQNLQGIDDSQLKSVTEKALTLSKITGADIEESLRGVNSLMTNFGMSANEAFDYMVAGAQRGLNKSGELEDNMAEYSQLWAQNGFSAKEMFAILDNGLKSGAYNFDKINDFVKEFGISLTDGRFEKNIGQFSQGTQELFQKFKDGKATTKDVFNSAITDMKNMKNQQDKLTLASSLWSSLGEDNAIKVIQSLNNTNHAFDNVAGSTDKASKALNNTPISKFNKAWRELQLALKPVGDTLLNIGTKILTPITNGIKKFGDVFNNMSPTMQGVTVGIGAFLASLAPATMVLGMVAGSLGNILMIAPKIVSGIKLITGAVRLMNLAFLANPIGLVVTSIGLLVGAFVLAYNKSKPFHDFVNNLASTIKEKVKPAFEALTNGIKVAIAVITPIIKVAMTLIKSIIVGVWDNIKGVVTGALNVIMGFVKVFSGLFTGNFKKMWDGIKQLFVGAFQFIWNGIQLLWFGKMLKGALSFIGLFKNAFKNMWNTIKNIFSAPIKWIVNYVKTSFSNMSKNSTTVFNGMKNSIKVIWNAIKNHIIDPIKSAFKTVTGTLTNLRTKALEIFNGLKDGAGRIWESMIDTFKKLPSRMADALKKGAKSIGNAMKTVSKLMLEGLAKGVNGVIGGINWILDKVHAPKKLRLKTWDIPKYANGTDNHQGGLAVVSDGKGKNKRELIALPNGQMFLSPEQETVLNLPKGASVLNGDATAQLLSTLPKYATGKGWLQGAWDKTKNVVKDVWEYASKPKELIKIAIDKFTNLSGIQNPTLGIVNGMINLVKDGAVDWIKKQFNFSGGTPSGSGVQRWRPYVIRALEMLGLSTSDSIVSRVLMQMRTESGGNPRAINLWDSNAKRGIPSKGLMQVIDPTFRAYALKGYDKDIYDPLSNILASLRYAMSRYGSLERAYQGHGYANGGLITREQIARVGEGNKPEIIIPLTKRARALQLLSQANQALGIPNGSTVTINNDYSEVIARQDQQIELMQQQIDLLTQLLVKDTTLEIDGRTIAKATAKYTQEELDRSKLNKTRAQGRVNYR